MPPGPGLTPPPPQPHCSTRARAGRVSPRVFAGLVRFGELALLSGLGFLIAYFYVAEFFRQYAAALALTGLASITVFQALGLYTITAFSTAHRQLPRLLMGWTATVGLLLAGGFLPQARAGVLPRLAGAVVRGRRRCAARLSRRRRGADAAGPRQGTSHAPRYRLRHRPRQREPAARRSTPIRTATSASAACSTIAASTGPAAPIAGYPNLGNLEALMHYCRRARIDMLVVALPLVRGEARAASSSRSCGCCPIDIRLAGQASTLRLPPARLLLRRRRAADRPHRQADHRLGRGRQVAVRQDASPPWRCSALAPLMALVALAIKLDSRGPVLFRQKRYGFNNELIEVFKFRSMYVDQADANAAKLVTKDDPRVTRVGRFIRKTSLDELPQLFNVILQGELSLVGPRPHALQAKAADRLYRRRRRRLLRAPQGQAGHHRLGADQRLARRDRHAGEDPEARRARPLLHRQLVGVPRPLHPPQDAVRAAAQRERLLSGGRP